MEIPSYERGDRVTRKSTRLWALALIMVFAFIACGGGDDPEPAAEEPTEASEAPAESPAAETATAEEFVSTLCTSMGDWVTNLQEGQSEVQANVEPGNIQSGIDALTTFFDSAVSATDELIASIEGAGVPDIDGGEEIQQELLTKFGEAKAALESARDQVASLPSDDPQAFADAAQDLGTTIQTQLSSIGDALSALSQADLDAAAAADPACSSLSSAGG